MVVFTCNNCGDTLQKPKVAKHYQFKCRQAPFVTCVDCLKDFRGVEYVAHTKCVTEAERYGGKDYVPKAGANKGERKQQEWLCIVNNLLNTGDLSNSERYFLNTLSKFENIPRKKPKFLNFVSNALNNRIDTLVVENVWNKMQNAYKSQIETPTQQHNNDETNITKLNVDSDKSLNTDNREIVENQNNENICKENGLAKYQNGDNETQKTNKDDEDDISSTVSEKKSKKRRITESIETQEDLHTTKVKKKCIFLETNSHKNEADKIAFDWKKTILDIVQVKGEIPLKKLQKKVVSQYMNYSNNTEYEKAAIKFNKKLEKLFQANILENMVKLL